jgi:uncharacterized DUF497 family protein
MYNVNMELKFKWDAEKNRENIQKHGVSFEEATTIFDNFPLEVFYDPDHSRSEDRYIAVGLSTLGRILLVVHRENKRGTEIRIISARKTAKKEQKRLFRRYSYEKGI